MPIYFLVFLASLAATVLLYVIAVIVAAAKRGPFPAVFRGSSASWLQAIGLVLLWWNVGVCWLLVFNVYPIHVDMHLLSESALQAFSRAYTRKLPIVVLPYGLACFAWVLALWSAPVRLSRQAIWGIATLCIISIVVTPLAANAQGDMQEHGFTDAAYSQLISAHVARTLAMSIAAVWALAQTWRLPAKTM
jgi:hypothetical protein